MTDNKPLVIDIDHVTKDYGQNRGNFDINLQVHDGECVGIVGENGAGKTTLLRQIMGFIRSDSGHVKIYHFDAYLDAADTKCYIGYIPGEINFPDVPTGIDFLHQYGYSLGMKPQDFGYADSIISRMQLDIRAYPRRMSKGMKQKTAIVASMMRKPPILLMDEPSTGLDPLMREELLTLIQEQKDRGSTMIMTSNSIDELELWHWTDNPIMDVACSLPRVDRGSICLVVSEKRRKFGPTLCMVFYCQFARGPLCYGCKCRRSNLGCLDPRLFLGRDNSFVGYARVKRASLGNGDFDH